ncbi:MAG: hypothetical protein ABI855_19585 [Bacteroidota bacterium]
MIGTLILKSYAVKRITFMIIAVPLSLACFGGPDLLSIRGNRTPLEKLPDSALHSNKFISLAEAEKVLRLSAHVKDSTWKNSAAVSRFTTNFIANASDKKTGQSRRLFFSYEQYQQDATAKDIYASIKAENEKISVVTNLGETGDEGFVAKDSLGFPFMMVRKGNKIYKFKMYYVTDKTAFEKLQLLAKRVVGDN